MNSGAEAVETALKLARKLPGGALRRPSGPSRGLARPARMRLLSRAHSGRGGCGSAARWLPERSRRAVQGTQRATHHRRDSDWPRAH
nr:hypothetical protein [Tanacetum cinerariifolium]